MNRAAMYRRLQGHPQRWDMIVVGGGATGVGTAIDAASRGYDVLLLEQSDFGKGTSSRSTKLVHGGVRYLEHGQLEPIAEAAGRAPDSMRDPRILREMYIPP